MPCPTKLLFHLLSFAVFTRGQSFSTGRNLCHEYSISDSDSFALQSLSAHLEITNSASQMENKRDTLCFEEIDPWRWQAGCQPVWLWYYYGSVRLFSILCESDTVRSAITRRCSSSPVSPLCWCVFGCHVVQKGKVVCNNISWCSWDLTQFAFISKLLTNTRGSLLYWWKVCPALDGIR